MPARFSTCVVMVLMLTLLPCEATYSQNDILPDDYQWHRFPRPPDTLESTAYSIVSDDDGNVYVAATSRWPGFCTRRLIQRYYREGNAPGYFNGHEDLFYYSDISADLYSDFPWQELVIDKNNSKIYVLFAATIPESPTNYEYFLASHELNTGELSASWGGSTRWVGESETLGAGLSVDSTGNVWTVLQEEVQTVPAASILHVKKWSGSDASELTLPADGKIGQPPDKSTQLVAFGIRASNGLIYLAYREETNPGASTYEEPIDLVVTTWTTSMQFLKRTEIKIEIPWPPHESCCSLQPNPDLPLHPYFHDGYVDSDENFVIGGYYYYSYHTGDTWNRNFYPVVLKFNPSLQELYRHVSDSFFTSIASYGNPYWNTHVTRVKEGPDKNVLYSIIPMQWYQWSRDRVQVINDAGQVIEDKTFGGRSILREASPPGGCNYDRLFTVFDFVYIPKIGSSSERYVESGPDFWKRSSYSGETCYWDGMRTLTTMSFHIAPKVESLGVVPGQGRLDWYRLVGEILPTLGLPGLGLPPSPEPGPEPCPWCLRKLSIDDQLSGATPPSYLTNIYRNLRILLDPDRAKPIEFKRRSLSRLHTLFNRASVGRLFSKEMKMGVLKQLEQPIKTPKDIVPILQATNALDLDWRSPVVVPRDIKDRKTPFAVNLAGVAWISFQAVNRPGLLSLKIDSGVPSAIKGFQPGWPVVTYHLEFTGNLTKPATISFYTKGIALLGRPYFPRIFQWDGKAYKDITTNVDLDTGVVSGKTDKLSSTFVVMSDRSRKLANQKTKKK